jgi:hypothetical protein
MPRGIGLRSALLLTLVAVAGGAGCDHMPDSYYPTGSGAAAFTVPLALPDSLPAIAPRSFPYSPGVSLFVLPADDAREDPSRIGVNTEGASPLPVLAAGMTPAVFVRTAMVRELAETGLPVAPREDAATLVLRIRLVRFFAEEGNIYRGDVRATVELRDRTGAVLFATAVSGLARQWGRSLSEENYREVFTRASLDLTKNVLENPQFQAVLARAASLAPGSGPADAGATPGSRGTPAPPT